MGIVGEGGRSNISVKKFPYYCELHYLHIYRLFIVQWMQEKSS